MSEVPRPDLAELRELHRTLRKVFQAGDVVVSVECWDKGSEPQYLRRVIVALRGRPETETSMWFTDPGEGYYK